MKVICVAVVRGTKGLNRKRRLSLFLDTLDGMTVNKVSAILLLTVVNVFGKSTFIGTVPAFVVLFTPATHNTGIANYEPHFGSQQICPDCRVASRRSNSNNNCTVKATLSPSGYDMTIIDRSVYLTPTHPPTRPPMQYNTTF